MNTVMVRSTAKAAAKSRSALLVLLIIPWLRAGTGPGVELLEYLAPRTGRPMPVDTQSNDEWHWQVNMTGDVAAADRAIRAGHYAYVSPGPVAIAGQPQLLIRDPDGHAQLLRAQD
jgi:hypothetical protein